MPKNVRKWASIDDLLRLSGAIAIALAFFYFVVSLVQGLVGPMIAVFVGESRLELNAFTIGSSEFSYGAVIQAGLVLGLVSVFAWMILRHRSPGADKGTRACPECTVPDLGRREALSALHLGSGGAMRSKAAGSSPPGRAAVLRVLSVVVP